MEKRLKITITVMFTLLFGAFIAMLKIVDVQPIGPAGTSVGLATVNRFVFELTGTNETFDRLTDLTLLIAFAVAGSFGLIGLIQFIKYRSLLKVSPEIVGLAVAYALAAVVYIAFELFIVNYRPVLEPGQTFPEASFPSSHTVLAFVILATAMVAWGRLLELHPVIARMLQTGAALLLIVTVGGRLLAGVHWTTDIIGGVLVSLTITSFYSALVTES